jgi:glycosyltransferase involved in cell wall biosynthesis
MWLELNPPEWFTRIPPVSLNWSLKSGILARSRLASMQKTGKRFDAAIFNHVLPATFLTSFQRRVPTIFSLDMTPVLLEEFSSWYKGVNTSTLLQGLKRSLANRVYRHARLLLAWSGFVRDSLVHDYRVDPNKIVVLPPGIDLQKWSVQRAFDHPPSAHLRILLVGAEFLRKGGDMVARAAQREEFRDCQFHFVTQSFEGPRPPNVTVHEHAKPGTDALVELYKKADIFVMPTRADFAPTNAVCEAMAMELPVITCRVGGMEDVVLNGKTGFVIGRDDESAFIEHLRILINSRETRAQFGAAARVQAEIRFDLHKNVEQMIGLTRQATNL